MKRFPCPAAGGMLLAGLALAGCSIAQERVGGLTPALRTDTEVRKAAEFAVSAQSKQTSTGLHLIQVVGAQTQVVAGVNYRLCLEVAGESGPRPQLIDATVYRDLTPKLSLTQWQVVKACPQAE